MTNLIKIQKGKTAKHSHVTNYDISRKYGQIVVRRDEKIYFSNLPNSRITLESQNKSKPIKITAKTMPPCPMQWSTSAGRGKSATDYHACPEARCEQVQHVQGHQEDHGDWEQLPQGQEDPNLKIPEAAAYQGVG